MKKILLFPLDMPGYAIKLGVFPLTFTFTELQKHYAIERMNDALSNKEKTLWFYPIVEGGAGSSFGGGVGIKAIDLFHEKYQLGAYYKIHINLDQYAHASFGKDNAFSIFDKPVSYEAITDFQRLTSVDYYGIGNSSSRRNHSQYLINNINGTFQLSIMPVKYFSIAPHVGFSGSDTGKGHGGGHPSIETVFPRSSLVGFDKWIEYFDAGIRIANDTTGNVFQPRKGGTRAFTFDHFQNFGAGSYNYNQYAFDIWQYIPLWNPCITLAIHNGWTFEQASGASQIPF